MLKTVTSAQMQELDRKAAEVFGIPSQTLMENAGRACADFIAVRHPASGKTVIFCGKGNNGGDGLVMARHLARRGWKVSVALLADPAVLKPGPLANYQAAMKLGIPVTTVPGTVLEALKSADVVVDALFGIGLSRPLTEPYLAAVDLMNQAGKPVYAVDVPSGLNADTGEICGAAVRAAVTLTLGLPKTGLYTGQGPAYAGEIAVLDIGLPEALILP